MINLDLAKYIDGFTVNTDNGDILIKPRDMKTAIDAISFKMLSMPQIPFIPQTISPCTESYIDGYLEHPTQVFSDYEKMGATKLICELKHMGSRGIILAFKDSESAIKYTGSPKTTIIYSRNGIQFFKDEDDVFISNKIQALLKEVNYYEVNETSFVLMDTEILPWSVKGKGLLTNQYLPVLDASKSLNSAIMTSLKNVDGVDDIKEYISSTLDNVNEYKLQLENYCWDTDIDNIKIAPFHILAHEGRTYFDKSHEWHLNHLNNIIELESNNLFTNTPYVVIDLNDEKSKEASIKFWEDITDKGYEGAMFKTYNFIEKDERDMIILPMMKARGKNYLRLIYGINYDSKDAIERLRESRRVGKKRKLHYSQTALSMKSLESFVKGEPFENRHDYVLAGLCLGSVVTDHRL